MRDVRPFLVLPRMSRSLLKRLQGPTLLWTVFFVLGAQGAFGAPPSTAPPSTQGISSSSRETEADLLEKIRQLSRKDLTFKTGSAHLTRRDKRILRRDARILLHTKVVEVLLIGHADERGNLPFNERLGRERGKSARDFLAGLGVAPGRVHIVSFGKRSIPGRLLCAEHREECWKTHRIVHLVGYFPHEVVNFQATPPPAPLPSPHPRVVTFQGQKAPGLYLLLPAGKIEVENVMMYLHNSSTQVATQNFSLFPVLPSSTGVNIERVDDDYYVDMISVYMGITHTLELEADIPYLYRSQTSVTSPVTAGGGTGAQTLTNQFGRGLGDIQYGVHYQFNTTPDLGGIFIGNVMVKSITGTNPFTIPVSSATGLLNELPTGTGFWALEPGLSIYVPITPVVFYANVNYIYNFARNFGGALGAIDPGNATDLSIGGWFSFSQKAIFSLGYDQMTVWPPSENGVQVPLTRVLQLGSVLFGGSYNVTRNFFYMVNVAAGVTPDAPNVAITIRFPLFF